MHILFCCTNQKNMLQKEITYLTLEVYLLAGEPTSWFPMIESLKMTCPRSYVWFLIFLSNGKSLDCLLLFNILLQVSEITLSFPKSVKMNEYSQFSLALSQQNEYHFWTFSEMTSLKIYISAAMERLQTSNLDNR